MNTGMILMGDDVRRTQQFAPLIAMTSYAVEPRSVVLLALSLEPEAAGAATRD